MELVRVSKDNYQMFDNMVYFRMTGEERVCHDDYHVSVAIANELENDNLYLYAIVMDNKMVGWISLIYMPKVGRFNGKEHVYVDELWVNPTYRGKGLSKLLMSKADELKSSLNAIGIRLYVSHDNETAKGLYESCGFNYSGKAFFMEK